MKVYMSDCHYFELTIQVYMYTHKSDWELKAYADYQYIKRRTTSAYGQDDAEIIEKIVSRLENIIGKNF